VARRPTQGDTLGNPFLNETANPNATSVKGGESAPVATIDSQDQTNIGQGGRYIGQIMGSRPSAMVADQPGVGLPGGGYSGPNNSSTGGSPCRRWGGQWSSTSGARVNHR
jgi:hypothetical protein